jgi:hypothetical protein
VAQIEQAWAGIDAGKEHHHIVVIDNGGRQLLSRRVLDDESELGKAIDPTLDRADLVTWAIDLADGPAVIADQARMRSDLRELHLEDEVIAELRMLTTQRRRSRGRTHPDYQSTSSAATRHFPCSGEGFGFHQPRTVGVSALGNAEGRDDAPATHWSREPSRKLEPCIVIRRKKIGSPSFLSLVRDFSTSRR